MSSQVGTSQAPSVTEMQAQRRAALFGTLTIAGIVLYVVIDVIAQLLPPHYSPIRQAESDLAVGPYGWLMTINFVLRGLLSFALIAGLVWGVAAVGRSRAGTILLGVWAAGALLLAVFRTDLAGERVTRHGALHLLIALIAFICVALGELLLSTRFAADPRWRALSRPALTVALLAAVACFLTIFGAALPGLRHVPGLTERVFLALALLWMLIVALRLRSLPTRAGDATRRVA